MDERDLNTFEDWKQEIRVLLRECDAVVVMLSPRWVDSEFCNWELGLAVELNKRLAPVILEPVPDARIPKELERIQRFEIAAARPLDETLDRLAAALTQDVDWVRKHTRYGEEARRWKEKGHSNDVLLRGAELNDAERWIEHRPKSAPAPTELHRAFIASSRSVVQRRMGFIAAVLAGMLALTTALAGYGFVQRNAADTSRRLAEEASRSVGGEIAERLSLTEGVPPDAVGRVLRRAGDFLSELIGKAPRSAADSLGAQLTQLEILVRAATASFIAGDVKSFEDTVAEIEKQRPATCPAGTSEPRCELMRASIRRLHADRALWDGAQASSKENMRKVRSEAVAAADDDALKSAITRTAGIAQTESKLVREPPLEARLALEMQRLRLIAADAAGRIEDAAAAATIAKTCALETAAREHTALEVVRSHCERTQAVNLMAASPSNYDEAKRLLDAAKQRLAKLSEADPTDLSVKHATALNDYAIASLLVPKDQAPDKGAVSKAHLAFERLIEQNPRNFQLKNAYLHLSEHYLADGEKLLGTANLRLVLRKRAEYLMERLEAPGLQPAERTVRERDYFMTLGRLYRDYAAADRHQEIVDLHERHKDRFKVPELLRNTELKDKDWVSAALAALAQAAASNRAIQREEAAMRLYVDLAKASEPTKESNFFAKRDDAPKPENWLIDLLIYLWSDSVRNLGELQKQKERIANLETLREIVAAAEPIVKTARERDETNYEFKTAYSNILAVQAWLAAKESLDKAHRIYVDAASMGSSAAIDELRRWVIERIGPNAGDTRAAEAYHRLRLENTPYEATLWAKSAVFTDQRPDKQFRPLKVYLVPPKQGEDVVDREVQRLRRYYRTTEIQPDGIRALKAVMVHAGQLTRGKGPITTRLIRLAGDEQRTKEAARTPFARSTLSSDLSAAATAIADGSRADALAKLELIRSTLEKRALDPTSLVDWAFLSIQYQRLRVVAAGDIAQKAGTGLEAATRQIKEITERPLPTSDDALAALRQNFPELLSLASTLRQDEGVTIGLLDLAASFLRQGIKLGTTLLRAEAGSTQVLWRIAQANADLGRALHVLAQTEQNVDRQQALNAEAMRAFGDAYATYFRLVQERPGDGQAALAMASALEEAAIAMTHQSMGELPGAMRFARRSIEIASEVWQKEQKELDALLQLAQAEEAVGRAFDAESRNLDNVIKELRREQSLSERMSFRVVDGLVSSLKAAERHFELATQHRIKILRTDPTRDCACKLDGLVALMVKAMRDRLGLERWRREALDPPKGAATTVDYRQKIIDEITDFLEAKIRQWREVIRTHDESAADRLAAGRNASDDERVFRYYIAQAELRKAYVRVDDLAEITNRDTIVKAYRSAREYYEKAVREMSLSYGFFGSGVDTAYATLLGDLAFAFLMSDEPEKARPVMDDAMKISDEYNLNPFDIRINNAHTLLLNGRRDDAVSIYIADAMIDREERKPGSTVRITWRDQVRSDLRHLSWIYPSRQLPAVLSEIEEIWRRKDEARRQQRGR